VKSGEIIGWGAGGKDVGISGEDLKKRRDLGRSWLREE